MHSVDQLLKKSEFEVDTWMHCSYTLATLYCIEQETVSEELELRI